MRKLLGVTVVAVLAGWAAAQQPPPPPDRYRIAANLGVYPQDTPQKALGSAVRALDKNRVEYFAAQLLDPKLVDDRVTERAYVLELGIDRELRLLRDQQKASPSSERLPYEPAAFDAIVKAEARQRAFRQVVADVREALAENPDHLKDLRRFARIGEIVDPGDGTAKLVLRDAPDRSVSFVKAGDRWFVLNPKTDPSAPKMGEAK